MFSKILVALDLSSDNTATYDAAVELALKCDALLVLLHVLSGDEGTIASPPRSQIDLYPLGANQEDHEFFYREWQRYEASGIQMLKEYETRSLERGVPTECVQVAGHPGPIICEVARTRGIDAIVIGRRGRTGLAEALLGSVSNNVVHYAPCSVLIVQPLHAEVVEPTKVLQDAPSVSIH
jgi:nucleotide-binding universal stress UspA family protein